MPSRLSCSLCATGSRSAPPTPPSPRCTRQATGRPDPREPTNRAQAPATVFGSSCISFTARCGKCLELLLQSDLARLQLAATEGLLLGAQHIAAVTLVARTRSAAETGHGRAAGNRHRQRAGERRTAKANCPKADLPPSLGESPRAAESMHKFSTRELGRRTNSSTCGRSDTFSWCQMHFSAAFAGLRGYRQGERFRRLSPQLRATGSSATTRCASSAAGAEVVSRTRSGCSGAS